MSEDWLTLSLCCWKNSLLELQSRWINLQIAAINLSTDRTDVPTPYQRLKNEKTARHFSRQKWGGFAYDHFSQVKKHRSSNQTPRTMFFHQRKFTVRLADWLWLKTERFFHHCHSVSKSQYLYNKMTYQDWENCVFTWLLSPRSLPKNIKRYTTVLYTLMKSSGERENCFTYRKD